MLKIALVGKARSGKDTIAEYADDKYKMYQMAFGDELKKQFHQTYPHIPRVPKPVRGYQLFGQLQRYVVDKDIWIDSLFEKIKLFNDWANSYNITGKMPDFNPIVTDVRQANEVARLKEEGFVLIRVSCPEEIRLERMRAAGDSVTLSDLNFETETELDSFEVDFEIINDGSLEQLYSRFDEIMLKLTIKNVQKDIDS